VKGGKEWEATFQLPISSFHSNFHLQSSHNLIKLFFVGDLFAQLAENVIKLFLRELQIGQSANYAAQA